MQIMTPEKRDGHMAADEETESFLGDVLVKESKETNFCRSNLQDKILGLILWSHL